MGGHGKGAGFERETCRELSRWVSNGTREDIFWRSAMSGGRATVALKTGKKLKAHAGDIVMTDRLGAALVDQFMLECKFYKDLQLQNLVLDNGGGIVDFWTKASDSAHEMGKIPILIAKQNYLPKMICLDSDGMGIFRDRQGRRMLASAFLPRHGMFVLRFQEFLEITDPLVLLKG